MGTTPTLVVISGPSGAGKTALAHVLHGAAPAADRRVTTVTEAAFQGRLWRPGLQPLRGIADIRVVHCQVAAQTAFDRVRRRQDENGVRRAHADAYLGDHQTHAVGHHGFQPVRLDVPEIDVDTSDGYRPGLDEIVAFVNAGR